MCQFGNSSQIIEEKEITQENAIKGYRTWYITNPFDNEEKFLKSLNIKFLWPKKEIVKGNPIRENSEGIYNYNNYNNYYNNNNNYNVYGSSLIFGKTFIYKDGYRSSFAIPCELCILSDKKWFKDPNTKKFAEHFNYIVTNLAKEYDCKVIDYDDWLTQGK